jgi:hypothetical protein
MSSDQQTQRLVDMILWKLGLTYQLDTAEAERLWDRFRRQPNFEQVTRKICEGVAHEVLGRYLRQRIWGMTPNPADHELFLAYQLCVTESRMLEEAVAKRVRTVITASPMAAAPPAGSPDRTQLTTRPPLPPVAPLKPALPNLPPVTPMRGPGANPPPAPMAPPRPTHNLPPVTAMKPPHQNLPPVTPMKTPQPQPTHVPVTPTPAAQTPDPAAAGNAPVAGGVDPDLQGIPDPPAAPVAPAPIQSQWQYLPLPENEPDPHTEFACSDGRSPEKFEILGARVRGKKHKHDGTHCDDWYSFNNAGKWTILAVSDGGGSYRFSRVGAEASCKAVTESLTRRLEKHEIQHRDVWEASSFQAPDVQHVYESLVGAVIDAWEAVKAAVQQRESNPEYEKILGRPLTTKDLYCTLLVTVHTTVRYQDADRSLIFGLAVGDGMMAAVDQNGISRLLMTPDSGEHSGEVRFLDQREVDPEKLRAKIFPVLCNLRALILMTDGVADDYFPNDPGMTWLYGDLVLNGVLPVPPGADKDVSAALAGSSIPSEAELAKVNCATEFELPRLDKSLHRVSIRSISALADKLGLPAEEVVRRAPLLAAGRGGSASGKKPEELLQDWLDSYHVRGSFDDRTLLVMHR